MKKILCLALVTLMIGCTFGVAGCEEKEEDDGIEYTAEKPILDFESVKLENEIAPNGGEEIYWTLKGYEPIRMNYYFEEFFNYYDEVLKGSKLHFVERGYDMPMYIDPKSEFFTFYRNNETGELLAKEIYYIYDEELGTESDLDVCTGRLITLSFTILIKPIEKSTSELCFEFGKRTLNNRTIEKYINIYFGEECFATCYFSNHVNIPQEWYENYLKENLIYGDDL